MFLPKFQRPGNSSPVHHGQYNHLFNKYGPAIYGCISKAANIDTDSADRILVEVFSITCTKKEVCAGNDRAAFIQLLQMMIRIMNKAGYQPCLPFMRLPCAGLQQMG